MLFFDKNENNKHLIKRFYPFKLITKAAEGCCCSSQSINIQYELVCLILI